MNIKENAELVEGRMTFIQQFLQKKYGFGILFFTLFLIAFIGISYAYKEGKKDGRESAKDEIQSLEKARKTDSVEMITLNGRIAFYKKSLDTCHGNSLKNWESIIDEALEKQKIINRKMKEFDIQAKEQENNSIKSLMR